jgi:hypothetical protein
MPTTGYVENGDDFEGIDQRPGASVRWNAHERFQPGDGVCAARVNMATSGHRDTPIAAFQR